MGSTKMMRFECGQCDMTATVVFTLAAMRSWSDHMEQHGTPLAYRAWSWEVHELPLDYD